MILVESLAPLVYISSSPHYILVVVGYHWNVALWSVYIYVYVYVSIAYISITAAAYS